MFSTYGASPFFVILEKIILKEHIRDNFKFRLQASVFFIFS